MLSHLKSTHAFKQKFSSGLGLTILPLTILPLTMELLSLHLGLEQLKSRTIKSSTMSQALHSTIIPEFCKIFKIKLRVSCCMTPSNLLIYVVFLDSLQGKVRFAFSHPTFNALSGAHRYGDSVYILAKHIL
jgi:hypothetical protein